MTKFYIFIAMLALLNGTAFAELVTLKNKAGKPLQVNIDEVLQDSVKVTTAKGKEFTIPFTSLNEESVALIKKRQEDAAKAVKAKEEAIQESLRPTFPEDPKSPAELPQKVSLTAAQFKNNFTTFTKNGTLFIKPKQQDRSPSEDKYFSTSINPGSGSTQTFISQNLSPRNLKVRYFFRLKDETTYSKAKDIIVPSFEPAPSENGGRRGPKHLTEILPAGVEEIHFFDFQREAEEATTDNTESEDAERITFLIKDQATERYTFTSVGDTFTKPKAGVLESTPNLELYSALGGGEVKFVISNSIARKISLTLVTKKEGTDSYSEPETIIIPSLGMVDGKITGPFHKTLSGDITEVVIYDVKKAQ